MKNTNTHNIFRLHRVAETYDSIYNTTTPVPTGKNTSLSEDEQQFLRTHPSDFS